MTVTVRKAQQDPALALAQLIAETEMRMGPRPAEWEGEVVELPGRLWERLSELAAMTLTQRGGGV